MKIGSSNISAAYIGSTAVNKIYIGSTEVWSSFTGLLDTYTGAAAAYSLRLLSASYTGSAIKVRRASDNTEQDIGFSNNELDTTSLASFCSGTNGFVTTWYDQSGNGNNATQTTAANQPQIVSSGSVITENGKPSLQIDDGYGFATSSIIGASSDKFAFLVHSVNSSDTSWSLYAETSVGAVLPLAESGSTSTTVYSTQYTSMNLYKDGTLITSASTTRNDLYNAYTSAGQSSTTIDFTGVGVQILFNRGGGRDYTGTVQELIFYASDQSSNRTGIETNINDFYSIY